MEPKVSKMRQRVNDPVVVTAQVLYKDGLQETIEVLVEAEYINQIASSMGVNAFKAGLIMLLGSMEEMK